MSHEASKHVPTLSDEPMNLLLGWAILPEGHDYPANWRQHNCSTHLTTCGEAPAAGRSTHCKDFH